MIFVGALNKKRHIIDKNDMPFCIVEKIFLVTGTQLFISHIAQQVPNANAKVTIL